MKRMSSLGLVSLLGLILTLAACSGGGGGDTASSGTSGSGSAGSGKAVISGHVTLPSTLAATESVTVTITADTTTSVASTKSDDYYLNPPTGTAPTQQLEPALTVPVDANGNFSAVVPAGTSYSTAVKLPAALSQKGVSFAATSGQGSIIGGIAVGKGESVSLTLDETHLQQPGTVTLRVVDVLTGTTVSGTTATLLRTGQSASVNADGTLTFTDVLPGSHILLLETAGYADVTKDFALTPAQALDLGDITINSQTGTVVGQVSATGFDSLAGIVVYMRGLDGSIYSVLTNASGLYRFERIPAAVGYSVLASANNLRSEKVDNIDVATGAASAVTTLYLQAGKDSVGAITGFARFAERADMRHAGIIVSIEGTDMEAITSRDGSFVLNNVPAGTYTLNYTDSNHQTVTTQGVKVVATAATKLDPVVLSSVSGGLSGEVRAQAGAALPGVVLTISGWGVATITDAQGKFTFAELPVGKHTLEASLPGYSASQVAVSVAANTTTPLAAPIELVPHHFNGRVLLGTGVTDHSGVSVTLSGASAYATTTASDGAFTLAAVPPGNYELILTKAGYKTQNLAVYIPADVADYTLPYDIKMTLNYGTLSGVARLQNADDHSGTSVNVAGTSYTTQTDFNGNWSMSLPEGSYTGVQYAHAGFITQNKTATITIIGEQSTALTTVTLNREVGSISGVVQNSSGSALAGVAVRESFSGVSTTTASNGSFTLSNIPVGTRTVTASLAGHAAGSAQVDVISGATSTITPAIALTPYTFTGKVSLGAAATDHSGVQLVLEGGTSKTTFSAADGSFSFSGAPAGNYRLTLSKSGYITKSVDLQIADVAVYTLPYQLDLAVSYGTLSGAVRLQNGTDHSGTTVSVVGTSHTTQTDISGNWSMSLPEGSYAGGVQYSHAGFITQSTTTSITITSNTGTSLPIVTLDREVGSISGVVQDSSGTVLAGAAISEPFSGASTTSAADGSFTLSNVAVGTRTVTASAAGHVAGSAQVTVASGATSSIPAPIALAPYQFTGTLSLGASITDHSGVQLVLEGPVSKTTFSAANGSFSFAGAPAGNYRLTLSKSGYVTKTVDMVLPDLATYTLPYNIQLTLSYGTLSGVARLQNGVDHSGTTVSVAGTSYTTQTDFNGGWSMSLPVGSYTGGVQYTHAGFITPPVDTTVITIASDTNTSLATVTLNQEVGTISGLVKNSSSVALWNVAISEAVSGASTTTAADGSFTLTGIPVGTRTVKASLAGYSAGSAVVNVASGAISDAPITLTAYQFTGKVSLGASVTDHSNVQLVLEGPVSKTTFSGVDGSFSFIGAPSGNYRLTLNKSGYVSKSVDMVLPDVSTYALPYTLDMTVSYGTLSGVARLQNSTDHSGTAVSVAGTVYTTQTDANGGWSMSLPVGDYTGGVQYAHAGFISQSNTAAITITSNTSTQLATTTLNQEIGSITGVVQDSGGVALPGAAISETLSGSVAIADIDGSFTLTNIPVGARTVTANIAGYTAGSLQVAVVSGATSDITATPIKLTPYQFNGTLSLGATVTDHSNVQLVLEGPVSKTTFSAANGSFSFTGAPAGNYRLTLSKSGYVTKSMDIVLTDIATYTIPYTIQMTLSYGTLSGVARLQNGTDHSGTAVNVVGTAYTAQTDANGSWSMSLPVGSYAGGVQYTHAGFITPPVDTTPITIVSDTSTPLATVTLNQEVGSISGLVQDNTGAALAGVAISEALSGASATTAANGAFTLSGIPVGTRTVKASLAGYTSGSAQVTVTSGAPSDISGSPITLTPYQFSGTLSLGAGVSDHSGVQLVLEGAVSKTTFSAVNGGFTFTGAPAGNYRLTLSKSGYVTRSLDVILSDVAIYTLPYTLDLARSYGMLSGVARLQNTADHSGTTVSVSGTAYTTQTDANGSWSMSLPVGTYAGVQYAHAGFNTQSDLTSITIASDINTPLATVVLQPNVGTLKGKIVDTLGTGIEGAQVIMVNGSYTYTVDTTTGGLYELSVATGSYTISAYKAGYGSAQLPATTDVSVNQITTAADLTLQPSRIVGSIVLEGEDTHGAAQVILRDGLGNLYREALTNNDGSFTLDQVLAGTYTLVVNENGAKTNHEVVSTPLTIAGTDGYAFTTAIQVHKKPIIADRDLLTFDYIKGANTSTTDVRYNLVLPLTMPNGSTVSWSSSNKPLISDQGVVTLPASTVLDKTATLTATLTSGTTEQTVIFNLTVLAIYQPKYTSSAQAIILAEDFGYVFKGMAASNENGEAINYAITSNTNPSLFESVSIDPQSGEVTLRSKDNQNGTATITIQASSGTPALTATASLTVNVNPVADPVGVVASVQSPAKMPVEPGSTISLNGSVSDVDGDATYLWELTTPSGSTATLNTSDPLNVTFTPDVVGDYKVMLTVSNAGYSSSSEVWVFVRPKLTVANQSVTEGSDVTFTLNLSHAYSEAITLNYATADLTAEMYKDYQPVSGSLTFAPGEQSKVITVSVTVDQLPESVEQFMLVLSNMTNLTETSATATATIEYAPLDLFYLTGENGVAIDNIAASSGSYVGTNHIVGDINGDGFDDVAIGEPYANNFAGQVTVVLGSSSIGKMGRFDAVADVKKVTITAASTYSYLGTAVSGAGDFNGDGIEDLVVTAPYEDLSGWNSGTVYIIYGNINDWSQDVVGASVDLAAFNSGTQGVRIIGETDYVYTGTSVAGVGDVNGDGYDDILIGAPNYGSYTGRAYLVYGAPNYSSDLTLTTFTAPGYDGSLGMVINGAVSGDNAGRGVGAAGDMNGDGYMDFMVTAPYAASYYGHAYLFFGSPSLPASITLSSSGIANGVVYTGASYGFFGNDIARAGDVNGDGYSDVVISAPMGASYYGEILVIYGSKSLAPAVVSTSSLTTEQALRIQGDSRYAYTGSAVAGAGDVNGDGLDDVLIGAYYHSGNAGKAYVVYGGATGTINLASINGTNGFSMGGVEPGVQLGASVSGGGDLDGDGYYDLLVANGIGKNSYLVFGGNHNASVTADLVSGQSYEGSAELDRVVADLGDETIVGNGGSDSISSGTGSDTITVSDLSFTRVDGGHGGLDISAVTYTKLDSLYIHTGGTTLDFTVMGPERIRNIEEIHFDGTGPNTVKLDAAAVRRLNNQTGEQVYEGKRRIYLDGGADDKVELLDASEWSFAPCDTTITTTKCTLYTHSSGIQFTAAPDLPTLPAVDVDDAMVNEDRGSVKVRLRRENGVYESTVQYQLTDGTAVAGLDYVALPLGVDTVTFAVGELVKEVTITLIDDVKFESVKSFYFELQPSPTNAVIGKGTATITILDDTIDLSVLKPAKGVTFTGANESAYLASREITSAGDINGDGYDDIIMGGVMIDPVVIFGGLNINGGTVSDLTVRKSDYSYNLDGNNGFRIDSTYSGWYTVTGIGDINGDGYDDLAVAYWYGLSYAGVTQLVFGGPAIGAGGVHDINGLDPTRAITISGIIGGSYSVGDMAGYVIARAGDVNRDGYDDLLIGAPYKNTSTGEAYLIYGHGGGWSDLALSTLDGTNGVKMSGLATYDYFGISVSAAGDMNGDGYDDFAIGAKSDTGQYSSSGKVYLVLGGPTPLGSAGVLSLSDSRIVHYLGWGYPVAGTAVASIGDFNRDGFDDLLVGAPNADVPAVNDVGEAYVIYGSDSLSSLYLTEEDNPLDTYVKLNGTNGFVVRGGADDLQKGMKLGARVAHLGDMNGDGYDDVLVAAPYYNSASGGLDDARGKAFIIYGNNYASSVMEISSLNITSGFAISAENIGEYFADSLGGGGDFNGDGFADLLLGAHRYSQQGRQGGRGYLIWGGDFLDKQYYVGDELDNNFQLYAEDYFYPKQGNDFLFVWNGPDYVFLGQGDDSLGVNGNYSDSSQMGKIDGGRGWDCLQFAYGGSINLTLVANNYIKGMECINLHENESSVISNSLTMGVGDIMSMLDSDKHIFSVNGDSGDSVTVTDGVWIYNGVVSAAGLIPYTAGQYTTRTYKEWSLDSTPIKLRIDTDIPSITGLP